MILQDKNRLLVFALFLLLHCPESNVNTQENKLLSFYKYFQMRSFKDYFVISKLVNRVNYLTYLIIFFNFL